MATEIKMPQLSDTMDSGKILSWNYKEGDTVDRGDILAEVETDKANLEIESFHKGTILKILTPADASANVGDVIAFLGQPGEEVPDVSANSSASDSGEETPAPEAPTTTPAPQTPVETTTAQVTAQEAPVQVATQVTSNGSGRIKASPLARKLAEQSNLDIRQIHGTGPDGRIVKRDVENAKMQGVPLAAQAPSTPSPSPSIAPNITPSSPSAPDSRGVPASGPTPGTLTPLSKMRETIAKRMQQSVVESPHFFTTVSVDMSECLKLRKTLKEQDEYATVNINHMIIKASAYALSKEPCVNCSMKEGQLFTPSEINVGIITAIDDGLLIPVIRTADKLRLNDLAFEARAAVDRARAGRPNSSDLMGGTFSISNMGMFDVESFTAIINPGQGAVLAVSAVQDVPVVRNGQIVIGKEMKVTLSVDHRIIDGIMSGNFLKHFKQALETPALLLI